MAFQAERIEIAPEACHELNQPDLADAPPGAKIFRAEPVAHRLGIGIAVFSDQDACDPALGLMRQKTFQRARQKVMAVAGGDDHRGVGLLRHSLIPTSPYSGKSVSLCAVCFSTAARVNGRLK